jgi:hypothetical protein
MISCTCYAAAAKIPCFVLVPEGVLGVDAVVYVELKLVKNNFNSLGRGTLLDIIQASIEAFEEAYNGFYGDNNEEKAQ